MQFQNNAVQIIHNILNQPDFKKELRVINQYAINIKQERPIVFLLAKQLLKEHTAILEAKQDGNKTDLVLIVKGERIKIEVKFHYGEDGFYKKNHYKNRFLQFTNPKNRNKEIAKDLRSKKPDIFIWVLSCRQRGKNYELHMKDIVFNSIAHGIVKNCSEIQNGKYKCWDDYLSEVENRALQSLHKFKKYTFKRLKTDKSLHCKTDCLKTDYLFIVGTKKETSSE